MSLTLPKYHIYLEYAKDPQKSAFRFNLTEEELGRLFVVPYTSGKTFLFCGRLLDPSKVDRVIIFWSLQDGGTLVLPNREMVAGHPNKSFCMERICAGKVNGVSVCTERFLPAKPKTEPPSE
jgi:hypothetical protein